MTLELCLIGACVVLLPTMIVGMLRILSSESRASQMLALLLFGTGGGAILLCLSVVQKQPALVDVALVVAILALVVTVAFVRIIPVDSGSDGLSQEVGDVDR